MHWTRLKAFLAVLILSFISYFFVYPYGYLIYSLCINGLSLGCESYPGLLNKGFFIILIYYLLCIGFYWQIRKVIQPRLLSIALLILLFTFPFLSHFKSLVTKYSVDKQTENKALVVMENYRDFVKSFNISNSLVLYDVVKDNSAAKVVVESEQTISQSLPARQIIWGHVVNPNFNLLVDANSQFAKNCWHKPEVLSVNVICIKGISNAMNECNYLNDLSTGNYEEKILPPGQYKFSYSYILNFFPYDSESRKNCSEEWLQSAEGIINKQIQYKKFTDSQLDEQRLLIDLKDDERH